MKRVSSKKTALSFLLLVGGVIFTLSGLWIPTKALLAQVLLHHAWQQSLVYQQKENQEGKKSTILPWPWADSWPVGRILVQRLGIDEIILEGSSGEALAFGPGHELQSALPGSDQHVILYGHRDTSFSFLAKLKKGDTITLEGLEGKQSYSVEAMEVVDASALFLQKEGKGIVSLITCYPFWQPVPGSTLRYLVTAKRKDKK